MLDEAKRWRDNLRAESPLVEELAGVSDDILTLSYTRWWATYSHEIRNAPSNRPGQGVSARDAKAAGNLATAVVLAHLDAIK